MTDFIDLEPFVSGDSASLDLRFVDDDGEPLNVAGDSVYFTMKANLNQSDAEAVLQKLFVLPEDGFAEFGIYTLHLNSADTNIAAGTYHYDLQWTKNTSANGEVDTTMLGRVQVFKGVTLS